MKQKNVTIKNKKHYSKAIIASILTNCRFLINFCAVCIINNENYFDFDKLVDFIYYCKLNNKYSSLIGKLYFKDACNSFKKAAEVLIQNNIAYAIKKIDEHNSNKSSLILIINPKISLNSIYKSETEFQEMQTFVNDYNKFIYQNLVAEESNKKNRPITIHDSVNSMQRKPDSILKHITPPDENVKKLIKAAEDANKIPNPNRYIER